MKKVLRGNSKGSTLLEAVIALTAIVIILAAASSLVITSLNNSTFSRDQNQANKLAQQGLEYIRENANNTQGFDEYAALSGTVRCLKDIHSGGTIITHAICDSTERIEDTYKREVLFTLNSPDCVQPGGTPADTLKATVTVYWQSGKCTLGNPLCHSQEVTSCFVDPASKFNPGI